MGLQERILFQRIALLLALSILALHWGGHTTWVCIPLHLTWHPTLTSISTEEEVHGGNAVLSGDVSERAKGEAWRPDHGCRRVLGDSYGHKRRGCHFSGEWVSSHKSYEGFNWGPWISNSWNRYSVGVVLPDRIMDHPEMRNIWNECNINVSMSVSRGW